MSPTISDASLPAADRHVDSTLAELFDLGSDDEEQLAPQVEKTANLDSDVQDEPPALVNKMEKKEKKASAKKAPISDDLMAHDEDVALDGKTPKSTPSKTPKSTPKKKATKVICLDSDGEKVTSDAEGEINLKTPKPAPTKKGKNSAKAGGDGKASAQTPKKGKKVDPFSDDEGDDDEEIEANPGKKRKIRSKAYWTDGESAHRWLLLPSTWMLDTSLTEMHPRTAPTDQLLSLYRAMFRNVISNIPALAREPGLEGRSNPNINAKIRAIFKAELRRLGDPDAVAWVDSIKVAGGSGRPATE